MNTLTFVFCNQPAVTNRVSVRQVFDRFVTPIYYDIHAYPIALPLVSRIPMLAPSG